jgi:23S rRNA pseudouridine2605 synthase
MTSLTMTFLKMRIMMIQRINKILSEAGLVSRRKADDLILNGKVMLNGKILRELGAKAEWGTDSIKVEGREIPRPPEKIYLILNKPFGYMCTLKDPEGRPIITDLLRELPQRVYPVGRLDFDSLGLILLTNDGDFSYKMTHPKHHVPRTYKVTVNGPITENDINTLKKGIHLEDGFINSSSAAYIGRQGNNSLVRLTISQGRNRIVRRMFEALGYTVLHLVRIGFGNLELGDLKVGRFRPLTPEELTDLREGTSQVGRPKREIKDTETKAPAKGRKINKTQNKTRDKSSSPRELNGAEKTSRPFAGKRSEEITSRPSAGRRSEENTSRPSSRRRSDGKPSRPSAGRWNEENSSRPSAGRRNEENTSRPSPRRRSEEDTSRPSAGRWNEENSSRTSYDRRSGETTSRPSAGRRSEENSSRTSAGRRSEGKPSRTSAGRRSDGKPSRTSAGRRSEGNTGSSTAKKRPASARTRQWARKSSK